MFIKWIKQKLFLLRYLCESNILNLFGLELEYVFTGSTVIDGMLLGSYNTKIMQLFIYSSVCINSSSKHVCLDFMTYWIDLHLFLYAKYFNNIYTENMTINNFIKLSFKKV